MDARGLIITALHQIVLCKETALSRYLSHPALSVLYLKVPKGTVHTHQGVHIHIVIRIKNSVYCLAIRGFIVLWLLTLCILPSTFLKCVRPPDDCSGDSTVPYRILYSMVYSSVLSIRFIRSKSSPLPSSVASIPLLPKLNARSSL